MRLVERLSENLSNLRQNQSSYRMSVNTLHEYLPCSHPIKCKSLAHVTTGVYRCT